MLCKLEDEQIRKIKILNTLLVKRNMFAASEIAKYTTCFGGLYFLCTYQVGLTQT
jgi:hypothetical protein